MAETKYQIGDTVNILPFLSIVPIHFVEDYKMGMYCGIGRNTIDQMSEADCCTIDKIDEHDGETLYHIKEFSLWVYESMIDDGEIVDIDDDITSIVGMIGGYESV